MQSVKEAQRDVEQLQAAIGAVSTGLDAVETAIEVADRARSGARRAFRIIAIVGLIVVAGVVIQRLMQRRDDPDTAS